MMRHAPSTFLLRALVLTVLSTTSFFSYTAVVHADSITGTNCIIASGASTCNTNLSYSIGLFMSPSSPNIYNASTGTQYPGTFPCDYVNGADLCPITYGSNTIQYRNYTFVDAQTTVSASCVAGTSWTGSVCSGSTYAPNITSVSPLGGLPGTTVTITGSNFGTSDVVYIVGGASPYTIGVSSNGTQITFSIPSIAVGAYKLYVVNSSNSLASNVFAFNVTNVAGPMLSSITPTSGVWSTWLTLSGANFGAYNEVHMINSSGAQVAYWVNVWGYDSNWQHIAYPATNGVYMQWQVPNLPDGTYTIYVGTYISGTGYIYSNSVPFTVNNALTISVTGPNGGDTWQVGTQYYASFFLNDWAQGNTANRTIYTNLFKGASQIMSIGSMSTGPNGSSGGSITWTPPNSLVTGSDYKVQALYYNSSGSLIGQDFSDAPFTINNPLPATASVTVSPNPGAYNAAQGFTLTSTNAIYCYIYIEGTYIVNGYVTSGTTYYGPLAPGVHSALAGCYNSVWAFSGWSTTNFTVNPPPATATLTASPTSIAYGVQSTLTWSSTNATSCTGGGFSTGGATSGSVSTASLTTSTAFTLSCTGAGGTSSLQSVTVTVSPPASCTLPWGGTLAHGSSVTAYQSFSVISPATCTSETRTCNNGTLSGSYTNQSCTVLTPPTATLTVSPTSIAYGAQSTLTWSSTNATSCIGGGFSTGGATSGSVSTGALVTSTTYTVSCTGLGGTSPVQSVTVTVAPIPPPTNLTSACGGTGVSASMSWTLPTGYTLSYFRITDSTTGTNPAYWIPENVTDTGPSTTMPTIPGHTYSWWVHTRVASGAYSTATTGSFTCANPPPTATLTASPMSVAYGGQATLTWSSTNATSCTAGGAWNNSGTLSGSGLTGALTTNTTYTFQCTGPGGTTALQSVTVVVGPTATLSVVPTTVAYGAQATLTWSSANATSCTAGGPWSNGATLSGSGLTNALTSATTFTFQCTGPGGTTALQSVTVNVTPTATFSASPTAVPYNSRSTLTWSSANATSCTAGGPWSNGATLSGSGLTNPLTTNTTFTFQCTGPGGTTALLSVTVTVNPLPTATLTASPSTIAHSARSTLTWSSTNATSCSAPSGNWSNSGTLSGSGLTNVLQNTTSFTFQCSGPGGTSALQTATVTVGPPAPCNLPWGGTISDGVTVTAYQAPSVISPANCISQNRTCNNGNLTGNFSYQSCVVTLPVPTAVLTVSPLTIDAGQSVTLTWSSTNATSCTAAGGFNTSGLTAGSVVAAPSPTVTSIYGVTCTGAGGSAPAWATVTVRQPQASITASRTLVKANATSTISWTATDVTSCIVSGPSSFSSALLSGQYLATVPDGGAKYTITCLTNGLPITGSVKINIAPDKFKEF